LTFGIQINFRNIDGSNPCSLKKITSIALLLIFLFNVGGYYVVFWALRLHTDHRITYKLDSNQYAPDETIELRIPVALPYPIYTRDFERVDGRFEHGGEFFKLVKHKFQNDTLYIVCIRDHETRELVNTMDNYVELTQTLPATNQKAWNLLSKIIKDYFSHEGVAMLHQFGFTVPLLFNETPELFLQPVIAVHAPPPRV
jgi:hypothetical protein